MSILDLKPHVGLQPIWDNNPLDIPPPILSILDNEGGGGTAFDTSHNGNPGTWNGTGTHWASGVMQFNGSDDYLIKSNMNIDPNSVVTVSMWLNHADTGAFQRILVYKNPSTTGGFGVKKHNDGNVYLVAGDDVGSWGDDQLRGPYIVDKWQHVVGVFSSGSGKTMLAAYIDGIAITDSTSLNFTAPGNSGDLYIGSRDAAAGFFKGLIGQVLIYNYALSAAQVHYIYTDPYYAWDYLDDTLITIIAAQEPPLPPTTVAPTTIVTTAAPTTIAPTTLPPTTAAPTTIVTTAAPTTSPPTTIAPTTAPPTTIAPTTIVTTAAPTTAAPTTIAPTTIVTTAAPTTLPPTTSAPTTIAPTTIVTTVAPTTTAPTTTAPTTPSPTTLAPTTAAPTTIAPTTSPPTTLPPTTSPPTTPAPTTLEPTTLAPTTPTPTTLVPTTFAPKTTFAPTTPAPQTTLAPTTAPPIPIVLRRGIANLGLSLRDEWR